MSDRIYYSREAEIRAQQERTMMIVTFLLLGLGIGAALALLFAPQRGEQTRRDIRRAFDDDTDALENVLNTVRGEIADLRKQVEAGLNDLR